MQSSNLYKLYKLSYICLLSTLIGEIGAFSLTPRFYDLQTKYNTYIPDKTHNNYKTYNVKSGRIATSLIKMDYSQYKSFDDIINILPEFHTRIIINNWLKYVSPDEEDDATRDYNEEPQSNPIKDFPEFVARSLYDFKIYIAINREETNTIYFGWCPDAKSSRGNVVYLVAGKVINSTVYIERIAQNPYYVYLLDITSRDLVERLQKIELSQEKVFEFNYDKLHEYDPRYNISWNFYTTDE